MTFAQQPLEHTQGFVEPKNSHQYQCKEAAERDQLAEDISVEFTQFCHQPICALAVIPIKRAAASKQHEAWLRSKANVVFGPVVAGVWVKSVNGGVKSDHWAGRFSQIITEAFT